MTFQSLFCFSRLLSSSDTVLYTHAVVWGQRCAWGLEPNQGLGSEVSHVYNTVPSSPNPSQALVPALVRVCSNQNPISRGALELS